MVPCERCGVRVWRTCLVNAREYVGLSECTVTRQQDESGLRDSRHGNQIKACKRAPKETGLLDHGSHKFNDGFLQYPPHPCS